MKLNDAVVLVTGANGGLGREFVHQALERGATKVYASARTPQEWDDPRIVPLALDVTSPSSIATAAQQASDVTVLINNAGASTGAGFDDLAAARALFDTNFWGQLAVTKAFAPVLARNGREGSAVVNVLSVLSWLGIADVYSATKAAFWSATNTQRLRLAPTQVVGLHLGYTDTPMTRGVTEPKNDPADVVRAAYDGLEAGAHEVLADEVSRQVKAALSAPVEALYPSLAS
ncbi:MAG: SDR family oxidoreductase [Marmoricola sp.]